MNVSVMLVDDHRLFREGTIKILEESNEGIELLTVEENAEEALIALEHIQPDVVILDINLPGNDGLYMLRKLMDERNPPKVLVLSGHDEPKYIRTAFKLGASGYLYKTCSGKELVEAILQVSRGNLVFPREVLNTGRDALFGNATELTARELEVLHLVAQGMSNKQIASHLYVSERTIHYHISNVLSKLRASSRVEALVRAREEGLLVD
ncbi:response regulator [Alicyclobacillus tolerans]|uniref:response regulator n=1 Tax=Alicyclobacillus tolerans TaxID=90970 RepID=UPI003B7DB7C6